MPNNNQKLDRVYLEYNPETREVYTAIDGDFAGIALAVAKAMRLHPEFRKAAKLACVICGNPCIRA